MIFRKVFGRFFKPRGKRIFMPRQVLLQNPILFNRLESLDGLASSTIGPSLWSTAEASDFTAMKFGNGCVKDLNIQTGGLSNFNNMTGCFECWMQKKSWVPPLSWHQLWLDFTCGDYESGPVYWRMTVTMAKTPSAYRLVLKVEISDGDLITGEWTQEYNSLLTNLLDGTLRHFAIVWDRTKWPDYPDGIFTVYLDNALVNNDGLSPMGDMDVLITNIPFCMNLNPYNTLMLHDHVAQIDNLKIYPRAKNNFDDRILEYGSVNL